MKLTNNLILLSITFGIFLTIDGKPILTQKRTKKIVNIAQYGEDTGPFTITIPIHLDDTIKLRIGKDVPYNKIDLTMGQNTPLNWDRTPYINNLKLVSQKVIKRKWRKDDPHTEFTLKAIEKGSASLIIKLVGKDEWAHTQKRAYNFTIS